MQEKIIDSNFAEILGEKYLAYALSTIMSRSLPDVRDGLKPVHRRLLYAMQQLRLRPSESYKKCARVVGDVIGKYHPHGDTAVYDTLVRLAQSFTLRYPLIDGQGNFGSIDGDNAAAMRYTESKLTKIAMMLMEDLEKDTVHFRATYDDSDQEPALLPAKFPNLLCNGSEGIAVGMATSIPPHNLEEICNAAIYLIDHRTSSVKELMSFIEGPDFPTGALIYDNIENIISIYETGKGSLKLRAKWDKEEFGHGLYHIVITEIPYQVQKSKLIENIANLLRDKKLPFISNIRDESAEDMRIIIEPKNRSTDPEQIMESLFKQTELETRVNYNMNMISSNNIPKVMNLKEVIEEFIEFRFSVITKRSLFEKNKIDARLEILHGLKIAYLNLDEIIKIIREEEEPKQELMKRFSLTDVQAESILNMRLKSLRKLEEKSIDAEIEQLNNNRIFLCSILENPNICWDEVKKEIRSIIEEFGKKSSNGARRTQFITASATVLPIVNIEAFIEKEQTTIILSKQEWIRSIKGVAEDISNLKFKDGDDFALSIKAYTTDHLLFGTKSGKFFSIFVNNISKGKGFGDPVRMMMDIEAEDDIISTYVYCPQDKFLLSSKLGKSFIVEASDLFAQKKQGKQIMNLSSGDSCVKIVKISSNHDLIGVSSVDRKILIFSISELPVLKKGAGVNLMKLKNSHIADVITFFSGDGFEWRGTKDIRKQSQFENWKGKRAGSGKPAPFGFSKSGLFS
ncbi:MAG: DNA topoisomerase IV subunit A [Alphaproteobacteria bacterium]|nr:DNA topoisomerase IV subunit A [Alphaproteobacteria bacterium]